MKQLSNQQLKELLKKIPVLTFEFDEWDYDEDGNNLGSYNSDYFTVDFKLFNLILDVKIKQVYRDECLISVELKNVWVNDIEYSVSSNQMLKIQSEITKLLKLDL